MDPTTLSEEEEEEEWELCNNDGFVYKRRRIYVDNGNPQQHQQQEVADPREEESRRRERRRNVLLKIKNEYVKEIERWELLSDSACAMEVEARQREESTVGDLDLGRQRERNSGSALDELLTMVKAQEAVIHKMSNLCDTAEAICNAKEEEFRQSMFNLPIWGSPRRLMSSLCDE